MIQGHFCRGKLQNEHGHRPHDMENSASKWLISTNYKWWMFIELLGLAMLHHQIISFLLVMVLAIVSLFDGLLVNCQQRHKPSCWWILRLWPLKPNHWRNQFPMNFSTWLQNDTIRKTHSRFRPESGGPLITSSSQKSTSSVIRFFHISYVENMLKWYYPLQESLKHLNCASESYNL